MEGQTEIVYNLIKFSVGHPYLRLRIQNRAQFSLLETPYLRFQEVIAYMGTVDPQGGG